MKKLKIIDLARWMNGTVYGNEEAVFSGLAHIDSRQLAQGDLFFAFMGQNTDGHNFIPQALNSGVAGAVVQKIDSFWLEQLGPQQALIVVNDVLQAVQAAARQYRQTMDIPVIAVTGSTGKTSTKDLLARALESSLKVMKSPGNFNNELGLPLTILSMQPDHEALVVEMGMRGQGQITELCQIAKPTIGVLTNIGPVHLELLGSMEAIAKAKGELLQALPSDGLAVVNGEDKLVVEQAQHVACHKIFYSTDYDDLLKTIEASKEPEEAIIEAIVAKNIESLGLDGSKVSYQWICYHRDGKKCEKSEVQSFQLSLPGKHQVANALSAIVVARRLNVELTRASQALASARLSSLRWETYRLRDKITLINDAYNANPTAMVAALKTLSEMAKQGRKVAILGDMYELGEEAVLFHNQVGEEVYRQGYDLLVTIGSLGLHIAKGALQAGMEEEKIYTYSSRQDSTESTAELLQEGDYVLVKASRGMGLESLVAVLVKDLS
ncbi:UDP-N-acetylmuramoyl-tripeptide--D-alanyl-D-alanine ligase [Heliorestis acidaminivorans]|uniref:UDP-N-acetylmuramoyl-tripeptide--D-alanyl-D-alanine ligase n=1 Tax=Heliorestis acidaminivorans TaxID=553427 RepID=A0A6I0F0P0_9FIRM|nr:UDP-N-acetylmuramoyl-tripeptide--D-alanyl-D-alanine ligase [Heliorestis acidaminivorans]KAB2954526.1 UDP-N-acetylmuramoyl-tripeptide--D-alanyl-D-alanine ligase [Heliorestis acidaminivorans]